MKRVIGFVLLVLGSALPVCADDLWAHFTAGGIRTSGITSPSGEIALGKSHPESSKRFVRGWSIGFRKDNPYAENGSYFTLRYELRPFRRLHGAIRPSVSLTWGVPGSMLDRSWDVRDERGDQISYRRTSPTRNVGFPFLKVEKPGVLYPSLSFSSRKHLFGAVYVEPVAGLHFIRFNEVQANFVTGTSSARDRWTVSPSLAVRISIRTVKGSAE